MSNDEINIRDARRWSALSPKPEPKPKPKPKLVTWKLCVLILPECLGAHYVRWYPSGSIPNDWYPVESHTQPIETVKQLPEGQEP